MIGAKMPLLDHKWYALCTFMFWGAERHSADSSGPVCVAAGDRRERSRLDSYLVLVVEDEDDHCQLLKEILRSECGASTISAKDGWMALRLAHECHPALILLDLWLPGLNGLDVAGQLKAMPDTRHIPIIALTATCIRAAEAEQAGCDDFVEKPFDLDVLLSRVRYHLASSRLDGAI